MPPPFIHAADWRMPIGPTAAPELAGPVNVAVVHHTVMPTTHNPVVDATAVARVGIERFGKMSYSYLVHPNGTILEAQGRRRGAHTENWNSRAVSLCLMGNYETTPVPGVMIESACWLLWALRKFEVVTRAPLVVPHRALKATSCPGQFAMTTVVPYLQSVARDQLWTPAA